MQLTKRQDIWQALVEWLIERRQSSAAGQLFPHDGAAATRIGTLIKTLSLEMGQTLYL